MEPTAPPLRGWAWPIAPGPGGGIGTTAGPDLLYRSMELILRTRRGERVMLPRFGCGATRLLFQPMSRSVLDALGWHVEAALRDHEPRVTVEAVMAQPDPEDPACAQVEVRVRLRGATEPMRLKLSLSPHARSVPGPSNRDGSLR